MHGIPVSSRLLAKLYTRDFLCFPMYPDGFSSMPGSVFTSYFIPKPDNNSLRRGELEARIILYFSKFSNITFLCSLPPRRPFRRPSIFSLSLQDLFHHVTATSISPVTMRNINSCFLYLRCRISRTTRQPTQTHHFIIGNIIAHIEYLLILQSIFFPSRAGLRVFTAAAR